LKRDAAWLLRRYYDGGAPDWKVEQILEWELNRLINERHELHAEVSELRRSAPERLLGFDQATDLALQWKAERRFGEALREIRRAAEDLSELRRFADVAAELERVSAAIEEIDSLLDSGLAGLTTPGVLRRLRDLARQLLDEGEARKAKFVVLLLESQGDRLRSRDRKEPASGLKLMLEELTTRGAEAVDTLRKLIREGYLPLAERLAEDLDSELAVRDRSRRASEAQGGSLWPLLRDLKDTYRQADLISRSLTAWLANAGPGPADIA
jgi:hypothetical protein